MLCSVLGGIIPLAAVSKVVVSTGPAKRSHSKLVESFMALARRRVVNERHNLFIAGGEFLSWISWFIFSARVSDVRKRKEANRKFGEVSRKLGEQLTRGSE